MVKVAVLAEDLGPISLGASCTHGWSRRSVALLKRGLCSSPKVNAELPRNLEVPHAGTSTKELKTLEQISVRECSWQQYS